MEKIIDKRFIEFYTFPWGPDLQEILELNQISIKLYFITEDEIEWIDGINKKIKCGYIAKIESKLFKCTKYINIGIKYFNSIYSKIYEVDFEDIVMNSFDGCDGGQFEIRIGKKYGFNEYYKKIGLWSPPCTKDKKTIYQIKKILNIYNQIKKKINYDKRYNEILLMEYKIYKENKYG